MPLVPFKGVPLYLNSQKYLVPSLSYAQMKENYDVLSSKDFEHITDENFQRFFDTFLPIVGIAIRRNYPEVTDELLGGWLDLNTFAEAVSAVKGASGLQVIEPGE